MPRLILAWWTLTLAGAMPAIAAEGAPAARAEGGNESTRVRVVSPEVAADRRVTFRLHAPKADEVLLSGEFMRGSQPMTKDERGVWSLTIGPLEPEIYHYNFTVDGLRIIDPGNAFLKTGSTASTLQSSLDVPGETPRFFDGKAVPHGEVHTHWYESKAIGLQRRFTVYTPPGYEAGTEKLPVVYLMHGANADETAWYRLGRVNLILDNLIAEGKIRPFLVVMPFAYGGVPGRAEASRFIADLEHELVPYVERRYRAIPHRDSRALIGLSMGGGLALSVMGGNEAGELFAYVAGFSSGLGRPADFERNYATLVADPAKANARLKMLWIGCGREDGAFAGSKAYSEFLTKHGVKHTFRETDGAHTWIVWRRYLHEIAPQLFR